MTLDLFQIYRNLIPYLPFGWRPLPIRITWKITSQCDLSCRMCEPLTEPDLPTNEILRIIAQLHHEYQHYPFRPSLGLLGGEPFLRPDILTIIEACQNAGFHCDVITNGQHLSPEIINKLVHTGVQKITFSIDGPETHHTLLRGKNTYGIAMEALHALVRADKNNTIQKNVNTILTRINLNHIASFIDELPMTRLKINLLPIDLNNGPCDRWIREHMLDNEALFTNTLRDIHHKFYGKTPFTFFSRPLKPRTANYSCQAIHWRCNIYADGSVKTCRNRKKDFLKTTSLTQLWNKKDLRALRQSTTLTRTHECLSCPHFIGCDLLPISTLLNNKKVSSRK